MIVAAGQLGRVAEESVEAYGARGRACAEHVGKGLRVVVDAELDWREWTDQQDKRREAVTYGRARCGSRRALENGQR